MPKTVSGAHFRSQAALDHHLLGKMHFFVRAVHKGSITSAAEEANIAVSTGSRWVQDLEQVLDLKLINRRGSNTWLTPAGECLFQRFDHISNDIQSLIIDLGSIVDEPQGLVKVCCTPIFAKEKFLPVLGAFQQQYRKIRFSLDVNSYGLKNHQKYDLIISAQTSYQPQETKLLPLVKRNLLREPFVATASPDYISSSAPLEEPEQLKDHHCLYADSLTHTRQWAFGQNGKTRLYRIPESLEVSDTNLLLEAARMGLGIAYLPEYVVRRDIEQGKLVRLLPEWKTAEWVLNLYYPSLSQMDHSCRLFKDFFLKKMS